MRIIERLAKDYQTISLVGMVKNAGKTTLLNELIDQASLSNVTLGLTTIGHDGEQMDLVTQTVKPLIEVNAGTLVATSKEMLEKAKLQYEVLEITDLPTAFGPIVIARALRNGQVELMGPRSSVGIIEVSHVMKEFGAHLVLIDGALDRMSSASPAVTDGVFLSTGAALSRDLNQVVMKTVHRMNLMKLKQVENFRIEIERLRSMGVVGVINRAGKSKSFDLKTGISAGRSIALELDDESELVFFPGALTYQTVKELYDHFSGKIRIVVTDGSKVFIEREGYLELLSRGLSIRVLDPINLIGVSINPVSPKGYSFDSKLLAEKIRNKTGDLPVINVYET
jgi:hypothetical protein